MSQVAVQSESAPYPTLLKNRNFVLLWAGYVISALGDRIHFIVMLALISKLIGTKLGDDKFQAGTVENAQLTIMMLLPFLLFGPITGIIADRFPRRAIMLTSDLVRVGLVITARIVFLRENTLLSFNAMYGILMGTEFLLAFFAAIFSPARLALLPNLVHPEQLLRANSMTNAAGTIASLLGFVIGGALIGLSLNVAMFVDAGTFFGSAVCLMLMKLPAHARVAAISNKHKPSVIREMAEGLRYITQHKRVMQVILLMLLFWSCGTLILNGLTGIITHEFGLKLDHYSYFMGMVGVGMIIGAASVSLARSGIPKEIGIAWSMVGLGFFLFIFSLMYTWQTALLPLVMAAAAGAVLLVSLDTLLQRIVPNFVRGRVMGAKDVITTVGLISVAVPLAVWQDNWGDINVIIRYVMRYLAVFVMLVGGGLVFLYYRHQYLPLPVAIARRFVCAYLAIFKRFNVGNAGRIPIAGPVIFVANHSTAYDPLCLQAASKQRLIQFMMAKEFYEKKPFVWMYKWLKVIPVNRTGNDTASIRAALRALNEGACIGMFPEGKISDDGRMNEGRQGVALLALMANATVVPAYIQGTEPFAGMVADFLKFNKVTLWFGKPIRFDDLGGKRDEGAREVATKRIMDAILELRERYETRADWKRPSAGVAVKEAAGV